MTLAQNNRQPDPEVRGKAGRRRFSADYKLRILEAAAACQPGEVGALLRQEGLYDSQLSAWRQRHREGKLLSPRKLGRPAIELTAERLQIIEMEKRIKALERDKSRLEAKLHRADILIDIQKKVSEILNIPLNPPPHSEND